MSSAEESNSGNDHRYGVEQSHQEHQGQVQDPLSGIEDEGINHEHQNQHLEHNHAPTNDHDHQLSQLFDKEMQEPKQESSNLSIDELDKMISESMNHDSNYLASENAHAQKRTADEVEGIVSADTDNQVSDSNKRQRHEQTSEDIHIQHNNEASRENDELDMEFENAIEKHHRETSVAPETSNEKEERENLQMIAGELQQATTNKPRDVPDESQEKQQSVDLAAQANENISALHQDTNTEQIASNANEKEAFVQGSVSEVHEQAGSIPEKPSSLVGQQLQEASPSSDSAHEKTVSTAPSGQATGQEIAQVSAGTTQEKEDSSANNGKVSNNDNLETATNNETGATTGVVLHEGINVPANSELLNTNTAFAAYNALSSQMPPLATLASAHLAALPLPIISPDYLPPRIQLLINTLPTLDNLATQFLRIMAMGPFQKILDITSNPGTPAGATFRDLASLLDFTKKLYSEEDLFLTVEHLAPGIWKSGDKTPSMFKNREQSIESTLRKVNLATFLGAVLGMLEVGFYYLNESFLDVFCPTNNLDPANALSNMNSNNMSLQSGVNTTIGDLVGKLLKPQAVLFLDLKTQAYISAYENNDGRTREEIIEDLFPSNLEDILLTKRGTKTLTPTELDFVERCKSRKDTLLRYPEDKRLAEEYEWVSFLKELIDYSSKNMGFLIWGKRGRLSRDSPGIAVGSTSINTDTTEGGKQIDTPHSHDLINQNSSVQKLRDQEEMEAERQRVQEAIRNHDINAITNSLLPSEIQEQQIHLRINPRSSVRNLQRRPWTREEENALRQALELKGPLWSTILELFGAGGKISEALKNRTQVQLKDKARNWKMFFLKSGLPVPKYLHNVTGDLEREDRMKTNKNAKMNKKNAAAPVPSPISKPDQIK